MKSKLLLLSMCAFLSCTGSVWGQTACPIAWHLNGYGYDMYNPQVASKSTVDGFNWDSFQEGFIPDKDAKFRLSSSFLYDPGATASMYCNYHNIETDKRAFSLSLPGSGINSTTHIWTNGEVRHNNKACRCDGDNCTIVARPQVVPLEEFQKIQNNKDLLNKFCKGEDIIH